MDTLYWMRKCWALCGLLLLGASCATAPTRDLPSSPPLHPVASSSLGDLNSVLATVTAQHNIDVRSYRLGPEDMVRITIFSIPESEGTKGVTPRVMEARISHQGAITLPLLGEIQVQGLTISEVEQKLQGLYDKYLQNPQIGVLVTEYRSHRVAVVGAVKSPGVFELSGPKTVIDLLAMSQGLSGNASTQVHLYRQSSEGRTSYVIDLLTLTKGVGNDVGVLALPVQSGDVIAVPEAGSFFVDGAVGRPGSYPLNRSYTVSQALVTAGGVNREIAKTSAITLFRRRGGTEVESVSLDLSDILSGAAQDPIVGAEDVIVVPISAPKYVVRRFLGVLVSGFSLERAVMY
jgi:polysaccharide biosynthesis/export protein